MPGPSANDAIGHPQHALRARPYFYGSCGMSQARWESALRVGMNGRPEPRWVATRPSPLKSGGLMPLTRRTSKSTVESSHYVAGIDSMLLARIERDFVDSAVAAHEQVPKPDTRSRKKPSLEKNDFAPPHFVPTSMPGDEAR